MTKLYKKYVIFSQKTNIKTIDNRVYLGYNILNALFVRTILMGERKVMTEYAAIYNSKISNRYAVSAHNTDADCSVSYSIQSKISGLCKG